VTLLAMEQRRRALGSLGSVGAGCYLGPRVSIINSRQVHFGDHVWIRSDARLECIAAGDGRSDPATLRLGDNCHIESYGHIGAAYGVTLGKGVVIGSRVTILDHDHGNNRSNTSVLNQGIVGASIEIGDYCWLGDGAIVLKGVSLGAGCVVGANAVVTRSFPAQSKIGGVPARLLSRGRA
jgi:acetyltransferase-like isoleucine patch superfamily enzyme